MPTSPAPGLRLLRIQVTGTQFEGRSDIIRTLDVGKRVRLAPVKDNKFDPEAVAIMLGRRQLGWVPREMATAIRGLNVKYGSVAAIGTDARGSWTRLEVEIAYNESDSPAAKVIAQIGPIAASVLHKMHVKDLDQASRIARLPKDEQGYAIEEWNMTQVDGSDRRRRKKSV